MTNRLAEETSPYLRQHAENPVDWYAWEPEAFQAAREQNKPVLLSVGYAACHWCHVMAHESFEDEETADFMNEHFINIKVDREERPEVDRIYMDAVVAMTGQGGWPMTVFLTPEGEPFYGGTYYPIEPRYGMPSFKQVMAAVVNAWQTNRGQVVRQAGDLTDHIARRAQLTGQRGALSADMLEQARRALARDFDEERGGFGGPPKFPPSMVLEFLLRFNEWAGGDERALQMIEVTLDQMAYGGMYDQVGGGFARYSVDADWLVPHFEKMLYDNALLSRVYLHAYQVMGKALYRRIAEETLDWVVREMRHQDGGFYSSLDADSEGEEGKFYIWTPQELRAILGDEADLVIRYYGVTESGNFEDKNILHVAQPPEQFAASEGITREELAERLARAKHKLYEARADRVWPGLDDKVLANWNGLMLASFAEAARILDREDYHQVALDNARFLSKEMRAENGRLWHSWKAGAGAKINGFLEDYSYLAEGLLALYQTTFDPTWFSWARELSETMLAHFQDEEHGGFFDTSDDHDPLIHRPKDLQDNATPSGNAMAANVLLQLSLYTGTGEYWELAERMVESLAGAMSQHPSAFGQWLSAATLILGEPRELAIIGEVDAGDTQALLDVAFGDYRPFLVVAAGEGVGEEATIPLLADRPRRNGQATAYLCRRFLCEAPVTAPEALRDLL